MKAGLEEPRSKTKQNKREASNQEEKKICSPSKKKAK